MWLVIKSQQWRFLFPPFLQHLVWFCCLSLRVWIPLVTSELMEQKCPEVETNQVKNKPETDTYFQNSITEEAGISHLGRPPTYVKEFAIGLGKGTHKYSYFNRRCLTWNSTWWTHLVNNGCLCPGKLFRKSYHKWGFHQNLTTNTGRTSHFSQS